jgi:hypothetical protein
MQQLKQKLILHLCNKETPEISGWKSISSMDLMKQLVADESVWLVNIHLNWKEKNLSRELRI